MSRLTPRARQRLIAAAKGMDELWISGHLTESSPWEWQQKPKIVICRYLGADGLHLLHTLDICKMIPM